MPHTCGDCGETFETLSRLRLHDCPGPDMTAADHVQNIVAETGELDRGDVVATFPAESLAITTVEQLADTDEVLTAFPLMSGSPGTGQTERIALQTVAGGCVLEYFPTEGWIAVRTVRAEAKDEDEIYEALMEQVQDWQATVTELALGHATGDRDAKQKLRKELGL
jgi:predicted  nucleic acid-binding Zn-ribbon protein